MTRDHGEGDDKTQIWLYANGKKEPLWPNGYGVGLLIQRLWVRVPSGVFGSFFV